MPDSTLDTVTLLEAAAARLRDKGWARGGIGPQAGPNCVMGAVRWEALLSLGVSYPRNAEYIAAVRALRCHVGDYPAHWNDLECPDAAEAVDALLKAAKAVAARATPAA